MAMSMGISTEKSSMDYWLSGFKDTARRLFILGSIATFCYGILTVASLAVLEFASKLSIPSWAETIAIAALTVFILLWTFIGIATKKPPSENDTDN